MKPGGIPIVRVGEVGFPSLVETGVSVVSSMVTSTPPPTDELEYPTLAVDGLPAELRVEMIDEPVALANWGRWEDNVLASSEWTWAAALAAKVFMTVRISSTSFSRPNYQQFII
jgi:hypothetical protein